MTIIVRMDDADPRLRMKNLFPLHQEFVKRNIPMTIAVNTVMGWGYGFDKEVLDYVNNKTDPKSWDIQLHGYEHERYWTYRDSHLYRDIFCNLMMTKRDFVHSDPKIFYPPWNETSTSMIRICKELGLEVKISTRTTHELLKWKWTNKDQETLYYWHWWTPDDCAEIPAVLDKLLEVNNSNKQNGNIL